jgi:5-methylcytosine-specific restriction endonuclease McrA
MVKSRDPRLSRQYKRQRLIVLDRDGHTCVYCGEDATQTDHVIPISKGGHPTDLLNLVACCKKCNVSKGNRSEAVFLARTATPPVFREDTSPRTTATVQAGPALGQPKQN